MMILSLLLLLCAEWTLVWTNRVSPGWQYPEQLELAIVIFRHGSRAPEKPYRNSFNKDQQAWPRGFGRLTQLGIQQEYELGSMLKSFYVDTGFITSESQVMLYSTNYDRTRTSARCVMAGMFPYAVPTQGFNENFVRGIENRWYPYQLPEWLLPSKPPFKTCPLYKQEFTSLIEKSIYEVYNKYKSEIDRALEGSGEKESVAKNSDGTPKMESLLLTVAHVADTLLIEMLYNKPIHCSWFNMELLRKLLDYTDKLLHVGLESDRAKRLTGGAFVDEAINAVLEGKVNGVLTHKLFLYSAHDMTVAAIMSAFGMFSPQMPKPDFSTAFVIELYSETVYNEYNQSYYKNYYVKFRYRDTTCAYDMMELKKTDCNQYSDKCDLPSLKRSMEKYQVKRHDEWKKECGA